MVFQESNGIMPLISMNQAWHSIKVWWVEPLILKILFEVRQVVRSGFWVRVILGDSGRVWSIDIQVKAQVGRKQGPSPCGEQIKDPQLPHWPGALSRAQGKSSLVNTLGIYGTQGVRTNSNHHQPAGGSQPGRGSILCRAESAGSGSMLSSGDCYAYPFLIWLIFPCPLKLSSAVTSSEWLLTHG